MLSRLSITAWSLRSSVNSSCASGKTSVLGHEKGLLETLNHRSSPKRTVISENAREGLMNEILYADDLVLMSESVENLIEKFLKWKRRLKASR